MSYAIIRNTKYKRENLKGIYRHNERKNKNYSNRNIDVTKSYLNYSLKNCNYTYEKEFDKTKEKYNLKGQVKVISNITCEYIITSDKEFFESIGEIETKRYFETAYKFVCDYKNLGEQYILSAKVHMDEETPHMHLVFIPVVHTTDKKGNSIDKLACSEFWKEKDSYKQLQDAFYKYMTNNGFNLERGNGEREHLSVEDYKKVTNFEQSKTTLKNSQLDLPNVPNISDFNKLTLKRDEKIQNEIIKPKNDLIQKLSEDNFKLLLEFNKQANLVNKAESYEKERKNILNENIELKQKCENIEIDYSNKLKFETERIEHQYRKRIYKLEEENSFLSKLVITLENTINKFIHWICKKFSVSEEDELIRNFEIETNTCIDAKKQIENENLEKEDLEY